MTDFQLEIELTESDTTFIDLSRNQIKELHDEVFGQALINKDAMNKVVMLEFMYIPFLFIIVLLVVAINMRWNRVYKRIKKISESMDYSKHRSKRIAEAKLKKVNIYDRLFVFIVIWASALFLDSLLMFSGLFDFPWVSIPTAFLVISKKLKLLSQTSSLLGIDDEDIAQNFDMILDTMIIKPIVSNVQKMVEKFFNIK